MDVSDFGGTLLAIDGLLHLWIEILNPETDTVEAYCPENGDIGLVNGTRVDFNREIPVAFGSETEATRELVHEFGELSGIQGVRRAAAKVKLDDFTVVVE
jgi:hypothetical protein